MRNIEIRRMINMKRLSGNSEPLVAVTNSNGDVELYQVTPEFEKEWLQDPNIMKEDIVKQLKQRCQEVHIDYTLNY